MNVIRLSEAYRSVKHNWRNNYRYHGGLRPLLNCVLGTIRSDFCFTGLGGGGNQVDILTFSIVPLLTLVWSAFILRYSLQFSPRIVIGDCSGGIWSKHRKFPDRLNVIPYLNETHGHKLDHFLTSHCQADYVLICDDDIFFLSDNPLTWALSQMQVNPNLAVISFVPRERFTWNLNHKEHVPMGSYCLLVRRELWLKERLSFRTVHLPSINPKSYKGEYDTADFANVELLRRGYEILIAPPSVRSSLFINKGISGSVWEMQSLPGHDVLNNHFSRSLDVTYANLLFVKEIGILAAKAYPDIAHNSMRWRILLERTLLALSKKLTVESISNIHEQVKRDIDGLSTLLDNTNNWFIK